MTGGHDEIRAFFDGIQTGPNGVDIGKDYTPSRPEVANHVLLTMGTAHLAHTKMVEDFGAADKSEIREMGDLELHEKEPILKAQAYVALGFNVVADKVIEGDLSFDVRDLLDWADGNGRAPTAEDMKGARRIMMGMKTALQPMVDALKGYVRSSDDFDAGILAFSAWEHYTLDCLGTCSCYMSSLIDRRGVRLDQIPSYKSEARERFGNMLDKQEEKNGGESPQMLSDVDAEITEEFGVDPSLS